MSWLSRRSYWSHLWIVQETLLARQLVVMLSQFIIFFSCIEKPYRELKAAIKASEAFNSIVKWRSPKGGKSKTMHVLLSDFATSECENFRDRVFGVLGLIEGGDTFPVDYSDSGRAIFFKTLQHFALQIHDSFQLSELIRKLKSAMNLERSLETSKRETTSVVDKKG